MHPGLRASGSHTDVRLPLRTKCITSAAHQTEYMVNSGNPSANITSYTDAGVLKAFPNGVVFGNTNNGAGYDLVLVGQKGTMKIDVDAIEAKLASPAYAQVAQSLHECRGAHVAIDAHAGKRERVGGGRGVAGRGGRRGEVTGVADGLDHARVVAS